MVVVKGSSFQESRKKNIEIVKLRNSPYVPPPEELLVRNRQFFPLQSVGSNPMAPRSSRRGAFQGKPPRTLGGTVLETSNLHNSALIPPTVTVDPSLDSSLRALSARTKL